MYLIRESLNYFDYSIYVVLKNCHLHSLERSKLHSTGSFGLSMSYLFTEIIIWWLSDLLLFSLFSTTMDTIINTPAHNNNNCTQTTLRFSSAALIMLKLYSVSTGAAA